MIKIAFSIMLVSVAAKMVKNLTTAHKKSHETIKGTVK